ncbi:hypothetical protein CUMW_080450 [Citrus unshiu]|uniref:Uncharacterized protein n=1 Tax=Citrus unshiu TaxID=55188 RepID=A0A2H5NVQ3_CITUN|nr:hypothetical protein CUMW_080450 [Citrus unshiu]
MARKSARRELVTKGTKNAESTATPSIDETAGAAFRRVMGSEDKSGRIVEGNKSTNPFETVPELPDGNESGKHTVMHPGTTFSVSDLVVSIKSLRSFNSFSASVSSSEDLFRVDTELGNFRSRTQPSKDEEINASNKNSSKSKALDNSPVPASTSRLSQFTNELMVHDMPPTQSPPIQVMDRSGEYDPLRIPSAIFETSKSSTPQEWSAASNESLFSIHIGNNSFSRDQFKSGELTKTDDMIMFNPSPTIPEVRADGEGSVFEKSDANGGSVKNTKEGTTVDKSQEKAPPANVLRNPSDMSSHSNESSCSFVFPILTDRVKSASVKPDVEEKKQKKPLATEVSGTKPRIAISMTTSPTNQEPSNLTVARLPLIDKNKMFQPRIISILLYPNRKNLETLIENVG